MPSPSKNETQDKFMERCMKMMHDENDRMPSDKKRPQKQMVAICMSKWREGHSETHEASTESEQEFLKRFLDKHPEYEEYFNDR